MGSKSISQQMREIAHVFPSADAGPEVETDKNSEEDESNPSIRRRERRASNESIEPEVGLEFNEQQKNELFNAEKKRIETETKKEEEHIKSLQSEKFMCRTIGGAVLLMASGAFAAIAHGLLSSGKK